MNSLSQLFAEDAREVRKRIDQYIRIHTHGVELPVFFLLAEESFGLFLDKIRLEYRTAVRELAKS